MSVYKVTERVTEMMRRGSWRHRCRGDDVTMSAAVKIAREIDESVPDVGVHGTVSLIVSSRDRTQDTEERVLAFRKDTTSHATLRHAGWRLACGASESRLRYQLWCAREGRMTSRRFLGQ